MAEVEIRDSTIKLFGKTIALMNDSEIRFLKHGEKKISCEELASEKTISEISENPSVEREISSPKSSKEEEQSKTFKKPNKILPCPRCNSTDTKFCYYNNYNVRQPRHFCKTCQRYWTAGGTTRNVPVGAGRRKNKSFSSSSQFYPFLSFGDESQMTSKQSIVKNVIPFPPQLHSFTGFNWPYPSMAPPLFDLSGFPVACYASPPSWTVFNPQNSSANCSVLGKHLRDEKSVKQSNSSVFGAFGHGGKGKEENYSENCSLLKANPAAFSRALKFREIV